MATPPDFSVGQVLTAAHMDAVGLWKITPTSVSGTGASIGAKGDVIVASGGTNFTVNGCFNADFRYYKIIVSNYAASGASHLNFSLGTAKSGTDHRWGILTAGYSGPTVTTSGNNGTTAFLLPIVSRASRTVGAEITLINPYEAQDTTITAHGVDPDPSSFYRSLSGIHLASTSYTATYWTTDTTQTITSCRLAFYGYN